MSKGYVHLYTGNGKGKTTAVFGLAVRAACAGKRVYIGQFIKGMKYSETGIADVLENIEIEQLGRTCLLDKAPEKIDIDKALEGLRRCEEIIASGEYDLVILDEVTIPIYLKMFTDEDVISLLKKKPEEVEIALTGRYAPESFNPYCDLITEMKEVKHYYSQGVLSREGIDV